MKHYLVKGKYLSDIANAIRAKTGTQDGISIDCMAESIKSISAGGSSEPTVIENNVNFYDYDGTLLYSYAVDEFQSVTEMPPLPSHDGLICQGWNWDIGAIKSYSKPVNVGAMYITDDGKTRIYIHLEEGRISPMLGCCPNGTVEVDWGDGSEVDILTANGGNQQRWTPTHNYTTPGDYVITLTVDGNVTLAGTSSGGPYLLRYSSDSDNRNYIYRNAIRKIELGKNVSFGSYVFFNCYSLSNITIPNGLTSSIGSTVFSNCYSLSSITIPDGVTSIGGSTFNNCRSLSNIIIPDDVTSIGSNAFSGCYSLSSITIPDSVTNIGNNAFDYCYSLSSITIPNGVTSISSSTFSYCYSLSNIIIPNSVTSIGNHAFNSCYSLSSITIPNSVTGISYNAFSNCNTLYSITIPDSVTVIGSNAFSSCNTLYIINIPNSVTSIGSTVFSNCYSLSSITIPDGVTSIGANLFYSCYSLSSIILKSSIPPTLANTNAFTNIPDDCIFYVPAGSLADYQAATNWSSFASRMQEYEV